MIVPTENTGTNRLNTLLCQTQKERLLQPLRLPTMFSQVKKFSLATIEFLKDVSSVPLLYIEISCVTTFHPALSTLPRLKVTLGS